MPSLRRRKRETTSSADKGMVEKRLNLENKHENSRFKFG
jgi:hypothetical protein